MVFAVRLRSRLRSALVCGVRVGSSFSALAWVGFALSLLAAGLSFFVEGASLVRTGCTSSSSSGWMLVA